MKQYILKYTKGSVKGAGLTLLQQTLSNNHVSIVDDSYPTMMLVQANPLNMNKVKSILTDWIVSENSSISLPDTKKRIK